MLEMSDAICERIAASGRKGPVPVEQFIKCAIENELRCVESNRALGSGDGNMAALTRQMDRLEEGQRVIVALVDSSAAILAELLRGSRVRR